MTSFDWFLVAWWIFGAVVFTAQVGKKREPITPLAAAIYIPLAAALIFGLLASRGAL